MNALSMVENFYTNHQVAAVLCSVIVLAWVSGNHLQIWRRLQEVLPFFTALVDLFFAPLAVVLFFTIVRIALGPDFSPGREWFSGSKTTPLLLFIVQRQLLPSRDGAQVRSLVWMLPERLILDLKSLPESMKPAIRRAE